MPEIRLEDVMMNPRQQGTTLMFETSREVMYPLVVERMVEASQYERLSSDVFPELRNPADEMGSLQIRKKYWLACRSTKPQAFADALTARDEMPEDEDRLEARAAVLQTARLISLRLVTNAYPGYNPHRVLVGGAGYRD